jgi:hypothetical protein
VDIGAAAASMDMVRPWRTWAVECTRAVSAAECTLADLEAVAAGAGKPPLASLTRPSLVDHDRGRLFWRTIAIASLWHH